MLESLLELHLCMVLSGGAPSDIPISCTTRSDRSYAITALSVATMHAASYTVVVAANTSGMHIRPFSDAINVKTFNFGKDSLYLILLYIHSCCYNHM